MLSASMTTGASATTRLSTAALSQAVHPRFEAPPTTKRSTVALPPCSLALNAVTVSIARTTLFVMGSCSGQVSSPVRRYLSQL
jgi:hypothetical protein